MREKLYKFMQGRYGNDQLNQFLMILMMIFMVFSVFAGNVFYFIGVALLLYVNFRIFSKDIYRRSAENQGYLRLRDKVVGFFRREKSNRNKDKTHHIFACPTCKQKIRVPKRKGKIAIRCPKCGNEFIKRT